MAASDHLHPEQLRMFMTAREIQSQYQPLDADREGNNGSRERTTWSSGGGEYPTARTWRGNHTMRSEGGSKLYRRDTPETDDELWERKADEAHDYGLGQEILEEGVQKPVSLGTGGGIGSSGKRQVVGGHHRIAVMAQEAPDELMPVLHYNSIWQARDQDDQAKKGRGGWRYT